MYEFNKLDDIVDGKTHIQGSAKEWSLGCVIPASWPPLAAGACFTQSRDHSLAGNPGRYKFDTPGDDPS